MKDSPVVHVRSTASPNEARKQENTLHCCQHDHLSDCHCFMCDDCNHVHQPPPTNESSQSFRRHNSCCILTNIGVITLVIIILIGFMRYLNNYLPTTGWTSPSLILCSLTIGVLIILLIIHLFMRYPIHTLKESCIVLKIIQTTMKMQFILENLAFSLTIASIQCFAIYLVMLSEQFPLEHKVFHHGILPVHGSLPEGIIASALYLPIGLYFVFKHVALKTALIHLALIFSISLALSVSYQLYGTLPKLLIGSVMAFFIYIEYNRQCRHSYETNMRLQESLAENEQLAEEVKANELRHMIGNVAHDLKTPLSSFISGIDVINSMTYDLLGEVNEYQESVSRTCPLLVNVQDKLRNVLEVTGNVLNTNVFMMMTINRCIDYNKTLFKVKLLPKNETFGLKDSIDFVTGVLSNTVNNETSIQCLYQHDLLNNGDISLKSDKQWFQENLLCLLGNAMKYSPSGSVIKLLVNVVDEQIPCPTLKSSDLQLLRNVSSKRSVDSFVPIMTKVASSLSTRVVCSNISDVGQDLEAGPQDTEELKEEFCESRTHIAESSLNPSKRYLKFSVVDCGPGIAKDFLPKLFEEPAQTARLTGGTGLGLYSLSRRVDALGGRCGVLNRASAVSDQIGCMIWFTLPFSEFNIDTLPTISSIGTPPRCSIEVRDTVATTGQTSPRLKHGLPRPPPLMLSLPSFSLNTVKETTIDEDNSDDCDAVVSSLLTERVEIALFVSPQTVQLEDPFSSVAMPSSISIRTPTANQLTRGDSCLLDFTVIENIKAQFPRVLVADDSPTIVKLTSLALKKQGYQVAVADNGLKAVDIYTAELSKLTDRVVSTQSKHIKAGCNVVLMDFQMPIMNGLQAMQEIRKAEQSSSHNPRVVMIGCSAKSDDEDIQEAYKQGMDYFLPKPFTIQAFHNILHRVSLLSEDATPAI